MGGTRVTVIDDSPDLLGLISDVLAMRGMSPRTLSGLPTMLDLEETDPHLILVDMRLEGVPELGCEFVRAVRDHPWLRTCPIVVFATSEWDVELYGAELDRLGVASIVSKPFALEELESAIDGALGASVTDGPQASGW